MVLLLPDVLLDALRTDLGSIDISRIVHGDPFRGARAGGLLDRIGDESQNLAISQTAPANTALPAVVIARN